MEEKSLKWDTMVVYTLIQGARRVNKKRLGSFIQASAGVPNTHADVTKAADNKQIKGGVEPD